MENWRRYNRRVETSVYRQVARSACYSCDQRKKRSQSMSKQAAPAECTCHQIVTARLPHLKAQAVPAELWGEYREAAGADAGRKRAGDVARGGGKRRRQGLPDEPDEGAAALLGDDALGPIKISSEEMKRGDEAGDDRDNREKRDDDDDADQTIDDGEDMDENDYEANYFDDDEQLVDEGGGGSDDDEPTY
jgi:hypothetical protein